MGRLKHAHRCWQDTVPAAISDHRDRESHGYSMWVLVAQVCRSAWWTIWHSRNHTMELASDRGCWCMPEHSRLRQDFRLGPLFNSTGRLAF